MLGVSIVLFVVLLAVLFAVAAVTAGFGDLMKPAFQDARPVGLPELRGDHTVQRGVPIPVYEPVTGYATPTAYDQPTDAPTEPIAPVVDDPVTEQFLLGDETQGLELHETQPELPRQD